MIYKWETNGEDAEERGQDEEEEDGRRRQLQETGKTRIERR